MTATTRSVAPAGTRSRARTTAWRVCRGAVTAAVTATIVVELYAEMARLAGVPMKAGFLGARIAAPITATSFAAGVLICTFWGAVLALVLARYAKTPMRAFTRTAVALAAVSLAVPIGAGATATQTKGMLLLAHILAASVVIPILAHALRPGPRRRGQG